MEQEEAMPAQRADNAEEATAFIAEGGRDENATEIALEEVDEQHLVLKRLLAAHEAWFNVTPDYEYAGRTFPGYAEFHSHGEQYVLVKSAKLWVVDAFEYLFFELHDTLTASALQDEIAFMTSKGLEKVHPDPNHMQSFVSVVIIANGVEEDAKRLAKKTSFRKNYAFGFRGWADLRVAVVDLSTRTVITNFAGKEMKESLELNAKFKEPGKKKSFLRR